VYSGHAQVLGLGGGIHSGKHGSIGGSLITISLHLHATGNTAQGLATGQVGDVLKEQYQKRRDVKHETTK
jgi:hypothetical protein